jgi:D-alanyl-D-alanine carboxypeptidase/D-alanyl-D-alanine-endopeptidase (penicillin-binding protein 4)
VFKESLPIAGVDGTLINRPMGPNARGNCRAKTGYVANVCSLSGYVNTKSGEPLLFVIFMNNHQCSATTARGIQDKIVEYLAGRD